MKKGIHRIAVPVGRTVQNFCSRRDYRAVVCSQLLSPPPFAKGALAVKVITYAITFDDVPGQGIRLPSVPTGLSVHLGFLL